MGENCNLTPVLIIINNNKPKKSVCCQARPLEPMKIGRSILWIVEGCT
ncbi:unnamed protein product [Larinioides sclopetarius]|uniref:Uncharacterized protein n=1 Tax=Larinioides sclopetarius TaxID=280406 RepID=A0AAV1Z7Y0_9ARAC